MRQFITALILGMTTLLMADLSRVDGVVTDNVTTLEWQDDYSDNGGNVKQANWEDAIAYCDALSLESGGWRLPNVRELRSIVDYSTFNPSINLSFQNTEPYLYWSSTSDYSLKLHTMVIHFDHGHYDTDNKFYLNHIRCVRDGQ